MRNLTKKLLSVLLALALACELLAVAAHATYGAGTKFVVLGDSIAAGEGASAPANAYMRLIAGPREYVLCPHAVGGDDSFDLLKILAEDDGKGALEDIRTADIIDISIGGNDLLASNVITLVLRLIFLNDTEAADEYIEAFRPRFAQIVEEIRRLNPDAPVQSSSIYHPK